MKVRRILLYLGVAILVGMIVLIIYIYPFYHFFFTVNSKDFDQNLTVMSGAGNTGILVTDSAVVVIDTKMGSMARKLYKLSKEKAGDKKIIVINTHFHGDHVYGNKFFKGCPIYIGEYDTAFARKNIEPDDMPTVYVTDSLILPLGNEIVAIYNLGQGHTYADLVVYLKNRKLLFTGDLVFNQINPALIREDGSDIEKWKTLLDKIPGRWDIKTVVPGHGNIGGIEMILALKKHFDDMQTAAASPEKTAEIKSGYAEWMKMPLMASPQRTIDFIKGK